jgi:hypothetical protein
MTVVDRISARRDDTIAIVDIPAKHYTKISTLRAEPHG